MTVFKVKTESGTTYTVDTTRGFWERRKSGKCRMWSFMASTVDEPQLPWNKRTDWVKTDVPIVGRRMYFTNKDEWQISTNVVSFEVKNA